MWLLPSPHHQRQAWFPCSLYASSFECVAARRVRRSLPACPAWDSGNGEDTLGAVGCLSYAASSVVSTGARSDPEAEKLAGWHRHGILVVAEQDPRLSWPERELIRQPGISGSSRTRYATGSSRRSGRRIRTDASCIITGPSTRSARCSAPAPSTRRCTMRPRTSRRRSSSPCSTRSCACPGPGASLNLSERQLHARRRVHIAMAALGGISSPAGSCVWHVVGLQCSCASGRCVKVGVDGRCGRSKRKEFLIASLGMLAAHFGYGEARLAS
jgi:hypothetical protein